MEITSLETAIHRQEKMNCKLTDTDTYTLRIHTHTSIKLIRRGEVGKVGEKPNIFPEIETVGMRLK